MMLLKNMSLDEVIQYFIEMSNCDEQRIEYRELAGQIAKWLQELKERREKKDLNECKRNIAEAEARLGIIQIFEVFNK